MQHAGIAATARADQQQGPAISISPVATRRNPEAVLHQALLLAREQAILQRTVEKAHRRIMELEVAAALGPAGGRSEGGQAKRAWRPWWFCLKR
jgi:hypothetical protein